MQARRYAEGSHGLFPRRVVDEQCQGILPFPPWIAFPLTIKKVARIARDIKRFAALSRSEGENVAGARRRSSRSRSSSRAGRI